MNVRSIDERRCVPIASAGNSAERMAERCCDRLTRCESPTLRVSCTPFLHLQACSNLPRRTAKYRVAQRRLTRQRKPFVASDTTTISIAEMSVIGTTGSIPSTNVPAAPRVMMRRSPTPTRRCSVPGGGGGIVFWMTATRHDGRRRPQRARQRTPSRAVPPEQRRDEQRHERGVAGKRVLRGDVEDRLRNAQGDHVGHGRDEDDEHPAGHDLHRVARIAPCPDRTRTCPR